MVLARDLSERDGKRDQQFDNSMTHNDSQNALHNANVIVESIYIITEIETYTITSTLGMWHNLCINIRTFEQGVPPSIAILEDTQK